MFQKHKYEARIFDDMEINILVFCCIGALTRRLILLVAVQNGILFQIICGMDNRKVLKMGVVNKLTLRIQQTQDFAGNVERIQVDRLRLLLFSRPIRQPERRFRLPLLPIYQILNMGFTQCGDKLVRIHFRRCGCQDALRHGLIFQLLEKGSVIHMRPWVLPGCDVGEILF